MLRSSRRAFTLAELAVAITIGGVAFGAFAAVAARQERAHARLAHDIRARSHATEALHPLASDLHALSPTAGDIPPGEARDSAIELRATVGTLVVCEVRGQSIVSTLASFVSTPRPGDSAWAYVSGDSGSTWHPMAISDVAAAASGPIACPTPATAPGSPATSGGPRTLVLQLAQPPPVDLAGAVVRLTRRTRYSLYRAPDARWFLGRREFSIARGGFETTQPVSGPFSPYAPTSVGTSGVELRYFDSTGAELSSGATETNRIVRIDVTIRTPPPPGEPAHQRRDATSIAVAPRNRR